MRTNCPKTVAIAAFLSLFSISFAQTTDEKIAAQIAIIESNQAAIESANAAIKTATAKIKELNSPTPTPPPKPDPTPPPPTTPPVLGQLTHYKVGMHWYPIVPATKVINVSGKWSELGIPKDAVVDLVDSVVVHYDLEAPIYIKHINIKGATLVIDAGTKMRVGTIQQHHGKLQIHNSRGEKTKIEFTHKTNQVEDPGAMLGGLIVTGGEVSVVGDLPGVNGGRVPYAKLSRSVSSGASVLTFEPETMETCRPGDRLMVVETDVDNLEINKVALQHETRVVSAATTTEVAVTEPLKHGHSGYVVNLDRQIEMYGSGHILFTGDAKVAFKGVSIEGLGTTTLNGLDDTDWSSDGKLLHTGTNNRGRYALHAHHLRSTHPFTFSNCVVYGKPTDKWSIVHHGSVGVIEDCVVVEPGGAAIAGEEGQEVGWWRRNLTVGFGHGDGARHDYNLKGNKNYKGEPLLDFGKSGYGYWYCSPGIQAEGNITVGRFKHSGWYPDFEKFVYKNPDAITYPKHEVFGSLAGKSIKVTEIQYGINKGSIVDISQGAISDWSGFQTATKKVRPVGDDWQIVSGDGINTIEDFDFSIRAVWTTGNQFTHPMGAKYRFRNGVMRHYRSQNKNLVGSATKNVWWLEQEWENVRFIGGWNGIAMCSKDCVIKFTNCQIEPLPGQSTDFFERIGVKKGYRATVTVDGETRTVPNQE